LIRTHCYTLSGRDLCVVAIVSATLIGLQRWCASPSGWIYLGRDNGECARYNAKSSVSRRLTAMSLWPPLRFSRFWPCDRTNRSSPGSYRSREPPPPLFASMQRHARTSAPLSSLGHAEPLRVDLQRTRWLSEYNSFEKGYRSTRTTDASLPTPHLPSRCTTISRRSQCYSASYSCTRITRSLRETGATQLTTSLPRPLSKPSTSSMLEWYPSCQALCRISSHPKRRRKSWTLDGLATEASLVLTADVSAISSDRL
jgi:hypothetical protein